MRYRSASATSSAWLTPCTTGRGLRGGLLARGDDALWAALREEWSEPQLIELIALAGFYHLIAFVTNALRIPSEPYGARFPTEDGPDAAGDERSRRASHSAGG